MGSYLCIICALLQVKRMGKKAPNPTAATSTGQFAFWFCWFLKPWKHAAWVFWINGFEDVQLKLHRAYLWDHPSLSWANNSNICYKQKMLMRQQWRARGGEAVRWWLFKSESEGAGLMVTAGEGQSSSGYRRVMHVCFTASAQHSEAPFLWHSQCSFFLHQGQLRLQCCCCLCFVLDPLYDNCFLSRVPSSRKITNVSWNFSLVIS